jgi:hypothetical protein
MARGIRMSLEAVTGRHEHSSASHKVMGFLIVGFGERGPLGIGWQGYSREPFGQFWSPATKHLRRKDHFTSLAQTDKLVNSCNNVDTKEKATFEELMAAILAWKAISLSLSCISRRTENRRRMN